MKIVIRAGGSGTRLWPLSRSRSPKQFLPVLGKHSLLEEKLEELKPLISNWSDVYISVAAAHVRTARRLAPKIPKRNIIAEPVGRNTGPAIALESAVIAASSRNEDPVIASLTVDDVFHDAPAFRKALRAAEGFLHTQPSWIVTIASKVHVPDPGLSYINVGGTMGAFFGQPINRVRKWVEKPSATVLKRLLSNPHTYAHTGLYVWKASTILGLFEAYQPEMMGPIKNIRASYGTAGFAALLRREYAKLPSMSIEEAVTRNTKQIAVACGAFGWSDTGKWFLIKDILRRGDGNVTQGTVLTHDTHDSLIYGPSGKMIGVVGMRGVIVVDTPDGLLVCPKDRSGDVKHLIELMRKAGKRQYL